MPLILLIFSVHGSFLHIYTNKYKHQNSKKSNRQIILESQRYRRKSQSPDFTNGLLNFPSRDLMYHPKEPVVLKIFLWDAEPISSHTCR